MWVCTVLALSILAPALAHENLYAPQEDGYFEDTEYAHSHPNPLTDPHYPEAEYYKDQVAQPEEAAVPYQEGPVPAYLASLKRPKLPSRFVTRDKSIPNDVYRFLFNAKNIVDKYPPLSAIFHRDTGIQYDPEERYERLFGFSGNWNLFDNLNSFSLWNLFDFGYPHLDDSGSGVEEVDIGADLILPESTTQAIRKLLNPTDNYKKDVSKVAGVEPCNNAEGVCQLLGNCGGGGENVGKCFNCVGCGNCCKFVYENQDTTNRTISFFQSPGYPDTKRDAISTSLNLEIRRDVSQVLLEFEDFEMPVSLSGHDCENDYLEIINPFKPYGIFGPGNSKLCGINTGQHIYLSVRPGDLVIIKAVTSGVGYVPLATPPTGTPPVTFNSGNNAYRFRVKITQIIDVDPDNRRGINVPNVHAYMNVKGDIPDYYRKLGAPAGCLQYYTDTSGTIESLNYDGRARFPNNLDYSICFRVPAKSCGISLQATRFGIAADGDECVNGLHSAPSGKTVPCCLNNGGGQPIEKYLGVDGVSDGNTGTNGIYNRNQLRYFFCGQSFGRTNFVHSPRKGPIRLQVFSDKLTRATGAQPWDIGFQIQYDLVTGVC